MTKTTKSPNKLAKTGKKAGIGLTEKQLDQASGGLNFVKAPFKSPGG
jgi:hypothetical protein